MNSTESDVCQVTCVHAERIDEVRRDMAAEADLQALSELFKVLGDMTRVRILEALSLAELCVCDLAEILALSQSAVSHQLRLLRAAKLVKYRREGKNAYYSLDDEHVAHLFAEALDHIKEDR
jgi:DNA-binding transcriptional ArsR family regulator